jgi:hypothetical protein
MALFPTKFISVIRGEKVVFGNTLYFYYRFRKNPIRRPAPSFLKPKAFKELNKQAYTIKVYAKTNLDSRAVRVKNRALRSDGSKGKGRAT